ncbi:lipocalin family protein [Parazoarcus communis]|uniref:lipocalin family protein n=1 Tax=Parazoarcus communis TaxID=41977 RepID=UPI00131EF6FA|nr:lipocalin family protein [Parazoarcus communis]
MRVRTKERIRRNAWQRYCWRFATVLFLGLAVALYAILSTVAGPGPRIKDSDPVVTERTATLRPLSLAADKGAHDDLTEWWYYTGHLSGSSGERYGFHATLFLRGGVVRHTVLHFSLMDLASGKRVERAMRTAGVPTGESVQGFNFRQADWEISSEGTQHIVNVDAEGQKLALTMQERGTPMLHRAVGSRTPGILDFGEAGMSYYYSRPRLAAKGTVRDASGKTVEVEGDVWFDHQWGDFDSTLLGWNWFALQMDDGSDLMIYELFDKAARRVMLAGSLQSNGKVTPLAESDLELVPVGSWQSERSRVRYPAGWDVRTPFGVIQVRPEKAESEFNGLETTFSYYWEGGVSVKGAKSGKGFLEMSGYDHIKALQPPK